jgi:flagellar basal body-associated protein FliL
MKKVALDLLEEFPDPDRLKAKEQQDAEVSEQITLDQDVTGVDEEAIQPVPDRPVWAFNKLLMVAVPIIFVVVAITATLIYYFTRQTPSISQTKPGIVTGQPAAPGQPPVQPNIAPGPGLPTGASPDAFRVVYLRDFMIDIKDAQGKSFVLMCDVALDVGETVKPGELVNSSGLRHIVYKTAQSRSAVALRSVEEREKMKQELLLALEKKLGQGSVKNVYFLNYFIM